MSKQLDAVAVTNVTGTCPFDGSAVMQRGTRRWTLVFSGGTIRRMGDEPDGVRIEGRVIVWYARGFLTRTMVFAAHDAIANHLAAEPGMFDFLFDGSAMQGFESGTPALSTLRMPRYRGRLRRIAIVVTRNPMLSAARAVTYLLPWLPVGVFLTRAEAEAFLSRDRRTTKSTA